MTACGDREATADHRHHRTRRAGHRRARPRRHRTGIGPARRVATDQTAVGAGAHRSTRRLGRAHRRLLRSALRQQARRCDLAAEQEDGEGRRSDHRQDRPRCGRSRPRWCGPSTDMRQPRSEQQCTPAWWCARSRWRCNDGPAMPSRSPRSGAGRAALMRSARDRAHRRRQPSARPKAGGSAR